MSHSPDRLYELLPVVYRQRDAERGQPLRELLQVIGEQVDLVEADIDQLYENWFIETCQDWVVPYIGDLVGYRNVHEAGEPGDVSTTEGQLRNKILIPRREVANTIHYRRHKGTLALLEVLANHVAGWPARAVEFYRLLGLTQAINHPRLTQGRTVDLRKQVVLDHLDGPFDELAHTVDVRRITSHRTSGRYNLPTVGLFAWRLKAYSVTKSLADCREDECAHCYTFSVLGNSSPLYTRPEAEPGPNHIADELNLPVPIRRRAFQARKSDYYGVGKSLAIWVEGWIKGFESRRLVPAEQIVTADLTEWHYRPPRRMVAVDPELGRIAFSPRQMPQGDVWVSYRYGFSADVGGGEYDRSLSRPTEYLLRREDLKDPRSLAAKLSGADPFSRYIRARFSRTTQNLLTAYDGEGPVSDDLLKALIDDLNQLLQGEGFYDQQHPERFGELSAELRELIDQDPHGQDLLRLNRLLLEQAYTEIAKSFALYRVDQKQGMRSINEALERWENEKPRQAIIEVADSGTYVEQITVSLEAHQTLQLRAANRTRPVISLPELHRARTDPWRVKGKRGSRFTLDGLLITDHGLQVEGEIANVTIRHSTLVPGWSLQDNCEPRLPAKSSLTLFNTPHVRVNIEHSIIGSIQFNQDEVRTDPIPISIADSILDATSPERETMGAPGWPSAHARLAITRSTVFGQLQVHRIDSAENSIFYGLVKVARRQWGCMRFCYVTPGSRTPQRYNCQPDSVEQVVKDLAEQSIEANQKIEAETSPELEVAVQHERLRVRPQFNSVRYGTPAYCQLAETCAEEIKRGADDESEMGVFHDLFQPQREANLRVRLDEYTPAGTDVGIIFAS